MSDNVIQPESAEDIFNEILDWYDIDEEDYVDKDEKKAFNASKKKLVKAICKGYLETSKEQNSLGEDTLNIQQNFKSKYHKADSYVIYREVNGRAKKAIRTSSDSDFEKMFQFLAALSGAEYRIIENLRGIDGSIAESLGWLFLQV